MNNPLALNPFKKGKKTEVEGVRKVEVEGNSKLEKVLKQYERIEPGEGLYYWAVGGEPFKLSPAEINSFLNYVIANDMLIKSNQHGDENGLTAHFINRLIRDSYDRGVNNFVLTPKEKLNFLGYDLHASDKNPLNIFIEGDAGVCLGNKSLNVNMSVKGNAGNIGDESMKCNFDISGDTWGFVGRKAIDCIFNIGGDMGKYSMSYLGSEAMNSTFIVKESVPDAGSRSKRCNFIIGGDVGERCGFSARYGTFIVEGNVGKRFAESTFRSVFSTHNKETYDDMFSRKQDNPARYTLRLLDKEDKVLKQEELNWTYEQ